LRKQLGETIRALGIPINLKGYRYLIEGTEMVLKNREILGAVTKELYPAIAKKNNTSWHSVEKAIRYTIRIAWHKRKSDSIQAYYGANKIQFLTKPKTSELIAILAEGIFLDRTAS
jgi:two-component system response regulator (stage 0 sporulation protein A)